MALKSNVSLELGYDPAHCLDETHDEICQFLWHILMNNVQGDNPMRNNLKPITIKLVDGMACCRIGQRIGRIEPMAALKLPEGQCRVGGWIRYQPTPLIRALQF